MKKILALTFSVVLLLTLSFSVFADGETVITTVVPSPEYVLTIPASLGIEYQCTDFAIGSVTATALNWVKAGDCVQVSVIWSDFTSPDTSTTIPMSLLASNGINSPTKIANGEVLQFVADESGTFTGAYSISANISSDAWNMAKPGNYAATVSFISAIM